jgi:hypothetical protein
MEPTVIWTEDTIEEQRKHEAQAASDMVTGLLAWLAIICIAAGLVAWK